MTQDIRDFVTPSCELLALGEPTHQEPAFGYVRNALLPRLAELGFRSIALETDRIAALAVDDYVRGGAGSLDTVLREGFTHDFGDLDHNRRLVAWMRAYNRTRPPAERLAFHGFDAPTENTTAPSPRRYLEHARDYLGLDLDIAALAGADERWDQPEAILDAAASIGDTAEADRLRVIADDLLNLLHQRAPERIAATSRDAWYRTRTHLTAGLGLLRYHRQASQPLEPSARITGLLAVRDTLMARNLLEIREIEARRGPTLVFAHNLHLQRSASNWSSAELTADWSCAGAILGPLLGEHCTVIAGSLGSSPALGLGEPAPGTHEFLLQDRSAPWHLTLAAAVPPGRTRTDTIPRQGYFPLEPATLTAVDAVLHITDPAAVPAG
ncbi:erythromycin esterase family protein [Kitasatospora paracochleata]|uniref:Erythromycin esterase-like protein n=1 Tax=Kitasatospora paracochleata TaxID=58354 RepID=A0ABT1JB18_9ACTN|nr:erythromycin esterase family protein [Kitasatospora paracochleata]MCP2313856.1 erythromycin esterase-like protein [Kitasatospora paracochleata]